MVLAVNALTTLADVKLELGITGSSSDAYLQRLINSASFRIENYCNRSFYYEAARVDDVGGFGGVYLKTEKAPLLAVSSITFDGETLDSDGYEIDNAGAGMIRSTSGFEWTAAVFQNITFTRVPGTERLLYSITYEGGYKTPEQSRSKGTLTLTGQPSDSETFVINNTTITAKTSGASTDEFNIGQSVIETCDNIVSAISAGSESSNITADRVNQTVVIGWQNVGAEGDLIVFTTSLTNSTADGSGTLGGTQAGQSATLPDDISDACILLITKRYRRKGMDPGVKGRKLLSHAETFGDQGAGGSISGIPIDIAHMLNPYKRIAQA